MSIKHRLILLIAISFIAIFAIGGYSIYQSRFNATEVKRVTEGVVPSALSSADLVSRLKEIQLLTMSVVYETDNNLAAQAGEKLSASKARLKEEVAYQLKQADDKTQQGLAQQIQDSLDEYFSAIDDTVKFKLSGKADIAAANYAGNVVVYQRELQQIVDTLRIQKSRAKDDAILALNKNLSNTLEGVSAATVITIAVLSTFGFMLYRQITRPISKMQTMMSEIASSQDFSHQVPVERMDEIGHSIVAFNLMIDQIRESSAQLKQKTTDIQTMLQNMPQGILTITAGYGIHPEYSAYLETIFERKDFVGRNVMDIVFSGTNLGADAVSSVEAAIGASVGEDAMNFEFNQHLLVGEIEKKMPDGRVKVLDLNWSPILDDSNCIVRLMLCIRDVTELRKLAAEAGKQKRELEIIGEILAVPQEKFHEFISSSLKFIDENEQLIRDNPSHNADVIVKLFRNMHTVKGNARTYALAHLTNIVHEAEQPYAELRKPSPNIAWDQTTLMNTLLSVREEIEHYAKVNEVSLGRKGPGRRGGIERYLMVDKQHLHETILRLEKANTSNLYELLAVHNEVRKTLKLLGTERLVEMLEGVFNSLPSLAAELGKVPPTIDVEDNGYVVQNQLGGTMKNIFMHLLRNSMDHGLETADERLAQGKPAAGNIHLQMDVKDGKLQIVLGDDGRGLALERMRGIALDKGMLQPDVQADDQEIADLIFRPGFSTAEKVTEVSGRGVGMDAVLNFIKRENGSLQIQFTDDHAGGAFRQFVTVVRFPQEYAESTEGFNLQPQGTPEETLVEFNFAGNHPQSAPTEQKGVVS